MQSSKKKPLNVGDVFITKQGCKATVIYYKNTFNVLVMFNNNHEHTRFVATGDLKKGNVKNPFKPQIYNIGYLGVGEFLPTINGKMTPEYCTWKAMLQRCYNEKRLAKTPTYRDCEVCKEWHNFQVFAEWYTKQKYYGCGYQIDKDLLVEGNKVYSPETCVLAPAIINSLFTGSSPNKTKYPIGVCWHKSIKKYVVQISIDGQMHRVGYFDNVEDAENTYNLAKKARVKELALEWENRIDEKLFNALMRKAS